MTLTGTIKKMITQNGNPIQYYGDFNGEFVNINQLITKNLEIEHTGFECFNCHKNKKILAMGYCFDCFSKVPQTGEYILRPELSTAHLEKEDRDLEYEKKVQLQPHVVYLANTGNLKVGVTRETQIPTRWIDQGASETILFAKTENRYLAGIIEVELKKYISDKTQWKKMLSNDIKTIDLLKEKDELREKLSNELQKYIANSSNSYIFNYPLYENPKKIKSFSFKNHTTLNDKLIGIKGQYLIFENQVLNWRTHEGYTIELRVKS
ncbi:MAG: DUF2797 domain-containing protein [Flavobacteriales bacterium]|nr:DUF2797 domain-containing protein [Flavobacteriales bacterium]